MTNISPADKVKSLNAIPIFMATPTPIRGVQVVGGIAVMGDFVTSSPVPSDAGFVDVQLKCGKGFPRIRMPRMSWSKPPRESVTFPTLDELQQQITTIINQKKSEIDARINQAEIKINSERSRLIDPYYNEMVNGFNTMISGINLALSGVISMDIYKYEAGRNPYKVGHAEAKGIPLFRITALKEMRKGIIGDRWLQDNWWQLIVWPVAVKSLVEIHYSLEKNKEFMDDTIKAVLDISVRDMQNGFNTMVTNLKQIVVNIPQLIIATLREVGSAIKDILTIIGSAISEVAGRLSDFARKVATAVISLVKNAVNDTMEQIVRTVNSFSEKVEMGYNTIVDRFNNVFEQVQCKVKEIENKLKSFDWLFGWILRLRLKKVDIPNWTDSVNRTLSDLTIRVTRLEARTR